MSGRSINFDDKKINKSNFYKNKKQFNMHDWMPIKYRIIWYNTYLNIIMIMSLGHYV